MKREEHIAAGREALEAAMRVTDSVAQRQACAAMSTAHFLAAQHAEPAQCEPVSPFGKLALIDREGDFWYAVPGKEDQWQLEGDTRIESRAGINNNYAPTRLIRVIELELKSDAGEKS